MRMGVSTLATFYSAPEIIFCRPSLTVAHTGRWRIRNARRGPPHHAARRRGQRLRPPKSSDKRARGTRSKLTTAAAGRYYPGKIDRDRGDDTYDIAYAYPRHEQGGVSPVDVPIGHDDGERETRVAARLIRKKDRSRSRSRSPRGGGRLREGDKVEADYRGRGGSTLARLDRDRGDDTYDIAYDDGERETRVAKRLIKRRAGSRSPSPKRGRKLREGAKVSARYRGRRSKFYPGRIERDRGDGTYDIYCDAAPGVLRPRRAASHDLSTHR